MEDSRVHPAIGVWHHLVVPVSPEALELENEHESTHAPTLGRAYALVRDQWLAGERDREVALHLAFLAWYLNLEPRHITGADESGEAASERQARLAEAHDVLLPIREQSSDAEALYVFGLMAALAAWLLGDVHEWDARSESYRLRYRELAPEGIDPAVFHERGAFGAYFGGQAAHRDGY